MNPTFTIPVPRSSNAQIKEHGSVSTDTVIDWADGGVQIMTLTAIINITFIGWDSLGSAGQAAAGTLILVDSGDFNPTWSTLLQTEGEADFTYTSDKAICLEFLNVNGGDNVPYAGWQVSSDTYITLGAEKVDDGEFTDSGDWTESANMSVTGGQLVLTAATSETTVEAAPLTAVVGASYLVVTVLDSVTTAGGGVKMNVGSTDGATYTTVGTKAEVIVATDTDGLEITAAGAAMTAAINSVSVKRLF
jgi:hypothetical protein